MGEEKFNEEEYMKGFNEGYMLFKYKPELATQVAEAFKKAGRSDRIDGFFDGRDELKSEVNKNVLPKWLQKDRFKDLERENDKDLDKETDLDEY